MEDVGFDFVDVSHSVVEGVVTYPGLPTPVISDYLSREQSRAHYASGTEFHIGRIDMVGNTGTYIDAPFHRYSDGADLASLPLNGIANLDGLVVHIPAEKQREIDESFFQGLQLSGRAVLVHTGWSEHWNTERYYDGHPYLTEGAAIHLRDSGAILVGIDSLNIDNTAGGRRPVHSTLLKAEIPIVEHLTHLDQLPDEGFRFFAVPVKVRGFGSFPVRAFGLISPPQDP